MSCDSKLIPTLIIFPSKSGEMLEGEIKIVLLNFFTILNSSLLIGPIITLAPSDLISLIAVSSLFLSLKPASFGIIKIFLSFISARAN